VIFKRLISECMCVETVAESEFLRNPFKVKVCYWGAKMKQNILSVYFYYSK